ncbi:MAG: hypothetical protein JW874_04275 [Spirochaetales bacterium]|nr:hypothetical protein [Spirochaetales bacterium]
MRFSKTDAAVTVPVILLSGLLFYLFWQDINSIAARTDENPLGTIEFKKRSATRRSYTGLNWERLQNYSPVFGGDTIRTAGFSEASIFFDDAASLDLFENTMIKLDFEDAGQDLEFLGGRAFLSGGKNRSILVGNKTITFSEDARVSLLRSGDDISVCVSGGTASIPDGRGADETIRSAQELRMNAVSGEYTIYSYPAELLLPEQDVRLVSVQDGSPHISFGWKVLAADTISGPVRLEIANHSDFLIAESFPAAGNAEDIEREPGVWYWRLADDNGAISPVRRFSLASDHLPEQILPVDNAEYRFRKSPPSIRFSWSEMNSASAYIFEVADGQDFRDPVIRLRTSLAALTIDTLNEGNWFWRVTPVIAAEYTGPVSNPQARRIGLVKRPEMQAPRLNFPVDGNFYELQEINDRGIPFSWTPDQEATGYQIAVAGNSAMDDPLVLLAADSPYCFLNRGNAPVLRNEGTYYWSVRWQDTDGSLSPWSPARRIQGIDGKYAVRLSYPPDGYTIADSLVTNTRFAWKSNVPGRTVFQVALDPDFRNVIYQEDVNAETMLGKNWKPGEWSWRIRTFNADGTVFLETPPSRFTIVEPFNGPALISPPPGTERPFIFRKGDPQTVSWEKTEGADYYSVKILAEGQEKPVFEKSLIAEEKIRLSFDSFPNGVYKACIQGFSVENKMSTRIIGLIRESTFILDKLLPIELVSPAMGEKLEGLDVLRKGINLAWESKYRPDRSFLSVYSDSRMRKRVYGKMNPSEKEVIPSLPEGRYYWKVTGSIGEYDISSRTTGWFRVMAIPPLPGPRLTGPGDKIKYGAEELKKINEIHFSWEAVAGATDYRFAIFRTDNMKDPVFQAERISKTSYTLDDLSVLDKGEFVWTVSAEARNIKGVLIQPGKEAKRNFIIDLPLLEKPDVKSGDKFYGR